MEKVIWLTGLPSAGKSTIAEAIKEKLERCCIIDGDVIREGLTKDLGFDGEGRRENIRIAAEVAKLVSTCGITVIVALISPYEESRTMARKILERNLIEVYVKCPLKICMERDPKGLYKKAMDGKIENFTGIDDNYEEPKNPDIIVNTDIYSVNECVKKILKRITNV